MGTSISELSILKCSRSCQFGGNCVQQATLAMCNDFRDYMWNPIFAPAPTSSERRERITNILVKAFEMSTKSPRSSQFSFFLEDPSLTVRRKREQKMPPKRMQICEISYVVLLGLSDTMQAPTMWRTIRADISTGRSQRSQKETTG